MGVRTCTDGPRYAPSHARVGWIRHLRGVARHSTAMALLPPRTRPGEAPSTRPRTAKTATPRASAASSASTTVSSVGSAKRKATTTAGRSVSRSGAAGQSAKMSTTASRVAGGVQLPKDTVKTVSPAKRPISLAMSDNEPIKAFLRIRPAAESAAKADGELEPYIEVISETEVLMSPPKSSTAARARVHSTAVPTKYAFSRVFPGDAPATLSSQSSFFRETALPLVEELVHGQSGLIFTYGVTNSGKSYTVQGGLGRGEAGILPRSMDTIFNSIKGLESTSDIRPVGLAGVERAREEMAPSGVNPFSLPGMSKKLHGSSRPAPYEHDATEVKVDRNYRYSVWVSYVEVYNEKIFDLLDAAPPSASATPRPSTFGGMTRSDSIRGSNWTLASLATDSGPIYLQRRPLVLKNDVESGGKYVAGLQEIRVQSAAEARELLQRGQENRQVFGTMANRASSRSHGVFTVKIIREHAGETDLTVACTTSRLSIVDLAGSERLGNTSVTGDRLKEAGSINKSLMCLGQCLETLRKNQARAMSFVPMPSPMSSMAGASNGGAMGAARVAKRRPSIVPFRHSKLTELFQSFFTGEGRAVMIVNVNPFDTGFDENSHVMRFSAAAKEVQTMRNQSQTTSLSRFVHPSLRDLFHPGQSPAPSPVVSKKTVPAMPTGAAKRVAELSSKLDEERAQAARQRAPEVKAASSTPVQEVTIIEEDGDSNGDEEESDSFVDHLMAKYEEVRHRLYQSERQCSQMEAQVREEMAEEMSRRLQEMESIFNARMLQDSSLHDDFINRKLDLFGTTRAGRHECGSDDESDDEVEESLPSHKTSAVDDDQSVALVSADGNDSSMLAPPPRKSRGKRALVESDEEQSIIEHDVPSDADETDNVSLVDGEDVREETLDEFFSSDSEQSEQVDEDEPSESDASFDISKESIESSFEAAPKRTSRGRASKAAVPKKPATKPAAASQKRASKASRKSTNGLPLAEKAANMSVELPSDDSLVLAEKPAKSPKKKRLLSKKTGFDQDALMDQMDGEQYLPARV